MTAPATPKDLGEPIVTRTAETTINGRVVAIVTSAYYKGVGWVVTTQPV